MMINLRINLLNNPFETNKLIIGNTIPGFNPALLDPTDLTLQGCYLLNVLNVNDLLTNNFNKLNYDNSVDLADNIINFNNFTFIGGSRDVLIDSTNYDLTFQNCSTLFVAFSVNS